MRHFLRVAGLALTATALCSPTGLADEVYRLEGPAGMSGYELTNYGTKVRLVKIKGSGEWRVESVKRKGVLIRVSSDSFDEYDGWYLSYDITGKRKEVFLTKKPGLGSYWKADPRGGDDSLTASAGSQKGWHLPAGKAAGKLKDDKGKTFTAYRAVLAKDPKPLPVFSFVELSP